MKDDILLEQAYSSVTKEQNTSNETYGDMKGVYSKAKEILSQYQIDEQSYFALIDLLKDTYFLGYNKGSEDKEISINSAYNLK